MPRRQQREDTAERSRSGRRYSRPERTSERDMQDGITEHDDIMERTDALAEDFDEGSNTLYAGEDLEEASLDELQELADELEIDEYEDMDRSELMSEIRDRI